MRREKRPRDRNGFEIAVICAVELESNAVEGVFDEVWEGDNGFGKARGDHNTYTTGRIGFSNVVLVYMPGMGKVESASVTAGSLRSFPNIKLGLVVGICGAVPLPPNRKPIYLGDVIISTGVEQFDLGRRFVTGFRTKDTLDDKLGRSTREIRSFLKKLRGQHGGKRLIKDTLDHLHELWQKENFESYQYPGASADILFPPGILHKHDGEGCDCAESVEAICDEAKEAACYELACSQDGQFGRRRSKENEADPTIQPLPMIHFGPIASGDQVIRDATFRDHFAKERGIIAFEMEGAGAWDNFPTIVIKGVCDYADSHKDKEWQPYAAAVAAACMKAFISQWISSGSQMFDVSPIYSPEPELVPEAEQPERLPSPAPFFNHWPSPEPEVEESVESDPSLPLVVPASAASPAWRILHSLFERLSLTPALLVVILALTIMVLSPSRNIITSPPGMPPTNDINSDYPIFAVIGRTGVGKSTFIKTLGGVNATNGPPEVCHRLETCTGEVALYTTHIDDAPIYLMDTPGFDDAQMSDKEVLEMIYNKLQQLSRGDKLIKGMIYLHDITQVRVGGLAARQFRAFEQLLGVDRFENFVFVTSKWIDKPSENESQRELQREADLKVRYWKKMVDRGSQVLRHDGSAGSAKLIIMSLIYKPKIQLAGDFQQTLNSLYNAPLVESAEFEDDDILGETKVDEPARPNILLRMLFWTARQIQSLFKAILRAFQGSIDGASDGMAKADGSTHHVPVFHKLLWTFTRVATVALIVIFCIAFFGDNTSAKSTVTRYYGLGLLLSSIGLFNVAGLYYRWRILSLGVYLLLVFALLLTKEQMTKGNAVNGKGEWIVVMIFYIWPLAMTYIAYLHWPYLSSTYYF